VFDPENHYLPRFDTDAWGTWFSAWEAMPLALDGGRDGFVAFNLDFGAGRVRSMMLGVALELALGALVLVFLLCLALRGFGRMLTRPILALTEGAEAVMARRYNHVVPETGSLEFVRLIGVFNRMTQNVRQMVNLKETLTKLLSAELAEKAAEDGLVLGGQEVECTLLFTDFAGFATLTRSMNAGDVVDLLNAYFGEMIPIVKRHGGFPDKFIGDAVVAIFGAPVKLEDHADRAVRCAIELQQALRAFNDRRRTAGLIVFEMRIGLNSGAVIAGAIGCDTKMEYTSIGETTNLAQRMETACPIGHVRISGNTYHRLTSRSFAPAVLLDVPEVLDVKGYTEPVQTYAIAVNDLRIEKDMQAAPPLGFYRYTKAIPVL
jgi:class 3 adenylate cyclase